MTEITASVGRSTVRALFWSTLSHGNGAPESAGLQESGPRLEVCMSGGIRILSLTVPATGAHRLL